MHFLKSIEMTITSRVRLNLSHATKRYLTREVIQLTSLPARVTEVYSFFRLRSFDFYKSNRMHTLKYEREMMILASSIVLCQKKGIAYEYTYTS